MAKKKTTAVAPWEVTTDMFLSEQEVDALLKHIRERKRTAPVEAQIRTVVDRLIVELLLFSGLRNSELCHLRVIDTAAGHGQPAVAVSGTPKQDRLVSIPQSLSHEIDQYIQHVRPACLDQAISPTDTSQPLILNERGRPYDRTALYRRVVRILTEAGLADRASVQLLRHTYGFLAYKRTGGNLLFVQHQLGHAHPMVTAVYAQFVEFSPVELADRVGQSASNVDRTTSERPKKKPRKQGI